MGIGTDAPNRALTVEATGEHPFAISTDSTFGAYIGLNTANPGDYTHMVFESYRTSDGAIDYGSIGTLDGNMVISGSGALSEHLVVTNIGRVGIGDATPDALLDVAGSFRLDGTFADKDGDDGVLGQILASTATGTD